MHPNPSTKSQNMIDLEERGAETEIERMETEVEELDQDLAAALAKERSGQDLDLGLGHVGKPPRSQIHRSWLLLQLRLLTASPRGRVTTTQCVATPGPVADDPRWSARLVRSAV